jgi:hypothetical protein
MIATIKAHEPRSAAPKHDTESERASASFNSSATVDSKLEKSQQGWDTKATNGCGLLGRMLDGDYREIQANEKNQLEMVASAVRNWKW